MIKKLIAAHMALMGIALTLTQMGHFMFKQAMAANEANLTRWVQEDRRKPVEQDSAASHGRRNVTFIHSVRS